MAAIRYRGIRVLADCEHCGMPLPLLGPVREAHCSHCQETNQLTPELWKELLDGVDCKGTSFTIPGKFDVDLVEGVPPEEHRNKSFPTPDWLQPLVPAARRFYGALEESDPGAGGEAPPLQVEERSAKPVLMSCPQCSASLKISLDTPRTCTCQYCSAEIYLPDDLWRRLHPVAKATRWYVEFGGENAEDRENRLSKARKRWVELRRTRHGLLKKNLRPGMIAVFAGLLCIPGGCANCIVGLAASGDPLFGLHSKVVCPIVCEKCTGPYIPEGDNGVDMVYCTSPSGRVRMGPVWIIVFPVTMWLVWFVLLLLPVTIWAAITDRKSKRRLPGVEQELATIQAELEKG